MRKFKKLIILAGDIAVFYSSLAITLVIRYGPADLASKFGDHFIPFSILLPLWIIIFYLFNIYQYKTAKAENILRDVGFAVGTATALSITAFYFFPELFNLTPKTNMVIFGLISYATKYFWQRTALFKIFAKQAENVILIGNSKLISETALHIKDNPHIGFEIKEWFDDPEKLNFEMLNEKIREEDAHLIVIQDHLTEKVEISRLVYDLLAEDVNVINFWNFYENIFERIPLEELEEGWFIENITSHRPFYDKIKRIGDALISSISLIVFSPIMLISAILIKFTSKGPIIFRQERVGRQDEKFILYKFRTMYEDQDGPGWTEEGDSRVTPVGKVLRRAHLDELPQLVNILKGDISLIGPRAESAELVEKYKQIPHYDMRHIIKPGFTGWAQLNYGASASVEEAKEKLRYDLYYIKNRSVFLDMLIILKTIRLFFTRSE